MIIFEGSDLAIADSSKFGTQLDGVPIVKGQAVPLAQGQLLRIGLHIHLRCAAVSRLRQLERVRPAA